MRTCFDCKDCVIKYTGLMSSPENKIFIQSIHEYVLLKEPKDFTGTHVGRCMKGHNNKMKTFILEHGKSSRDEIEADHTLEMDCFTSHESTTALDAIISKTDEMLKMIK